MKLDNIKKSIVYDTSSINLLRSRKLKEIVSPNNLKTSNGESIFICDKEKIHGIIILNEPTNITRDILKNRFKRHQLSEEVIDTNWPSLKRFNAHSFRIKKVFKEPLEFRYSGKGCLKNGELLNNVEIIDREKEALEQKINKYKDRLDTLKGFKCSEEKEIVKDLFLELFGLVINKMEEPKSKAKELINA
jgi:hypothetical protein